jgi:hypothetical protein
MNCAKYREEMATLDITLRGVTADSTVSIHIQVDGVEKTPRRVEKAGDVKADLLHADLTSHKRKKLASAAKSASSRPPDRLRPTDKLVLDALRARIPQGETETPPVRVRELMGECFISRRQVGICLRRLNEKGMIRRVGEDTLSGRVEGYRYRILEPS